MSQATAFNGSSCHVWCHDAAYAMTEALADGDDGPPTAAEQHSLPIRPRPLRALVRHHPGPPVAALPASPLVLADYLAEHAGTRRRPVGSGRIPTLGFRASSRVDSCSRRNTRAVRDDVIARRQ